MGYWYGYVAKRHLELEASHQIHGSLAVLPLQKNMITLEKTFVSGDGGFSADPLTYTQLNRTATAAVYERSRNGKVMDYEVFKIKILAKGTKVFQNITEDDQEKYPGASQFGISAWCCISKAIAMARYVELSKDVVEEKKELTIPTKEFTVGEFAEQNGMTYANAFLFIKSAAKSGSVKFIREERRNVKGKASKIYAKG